jgi:hypothetical protein
MSQKIIKWKTGSIKSAPKLKNISLKKVDVPKIKGMKIPKIKASGISKIRFSNITNSYGRKLKLK